MAGSFADYAEAAVLNEIFGATAFGAAATHYFALFTAAPTDAGGGTECTGGSYARKSMTNNATTWPAATGTSPTTKTLGAAVTFVTATASWGTVVAMGIFDASSGGNLIAWADLTASKAVGNGDTAQFAASSVTITLD